MQITHLDVPVDQVVDLEVFVVVAEGVEQGLRNLDPTHVTDELDHNEKRKPELTN